MRANLVLANIGIVLKYVSVFMAVSAGISLYNGMDSAFYPLLLSALMTFILGVFPSLFVKQNDGLSSKEGFLIVAGSWIVVSIVGMFPYLIWGGEFTLENAWFESVSGFTATGATILNDIEDLPQGLLFWRTSTNWIGGAGVVLFALIIMPSLGKNKMALNSVEMSNLAKDNYNYKTQSVIKILLIVYVSLTLCTMFALKLAGMRWFDAVNHAMSACATGGFSTKNSSIGFFNSPVIECLLMLAMFLSSVHLGLIYATFTGKRSNIFRSEVVRKYVLLIVIVIVLVSSSLAVNSEGESYLASLRKSSFQVVSLITTTGFSTADTSVWPPLAMICLIFISLVCGCAGSTSGGMKMDRLIIFLKQLRARVDQQQHPNAIIRIRLDGMVHEQSQIHNVMTFISTYLFLILLGTVTSAMCGLDLTTAFSSSVSCLGNVGPGFGQVGSTLNYNAVPAVLKIQDTVLMLMGRLEIFGFIQLLMMRQWK